MIKQIVNSWITYQDLIVDIDGAPIKIEVIVMGECVLIDMANPVIRKMLGEKRVRLRVLIEQLIKTASEEYREAMDKLDRP